MRRWPGLPAVTAGPLSIPFRTQARAFTTWAGARVRGAPYLRKWLVLGCLVGVIAGLGAVAFYQTLTLATHLFLTDLAGYQIPTVSSEGFLAGSAHFVRPWAIPLIVGLGGLASGALVIAVAPEAEGHGTDAAIDAVHRNPRGVRLRTVAVKIVASAITIGSGGSGGREGPTAQISAGFGSYLARALDLSPADGRVAVAAGIGSGIGSIFGAPLGGALLSAEILYRDDIEVEAIIPSMIASIMGYAVSSAFMGFQPLFGFAAPGYQFDPAQLGWFALIGVIGGFIGLAYSTGFYGLSGIFSRLAVPRFVRPAIGGVLVGLLALAVPQVMGTGYGWVQKTLGEQLLGLPLWIVLALPFAKILATSLSIGSGGSGGIFGPGMVIGAFTGAAIWRLLEPVAPGVPGGPAPFVIVAIMATFGSICRAPLAVMLMVAEMTGSLTALAPAMIAVGIATLIVRRVDRTIYTSQLKSRADSPAHRMRRGMPLLGALEVADFMTPPRVVLPGNLAVAKGAAIVQAAGVPGAPVTDERGAFTGVVTRAALAAVADAAPDGTADDGVTTIVGRLVDPAAPTTTPDRHLDSALESLLDARVNWIPVLDEQRQVVGILTTAAVVRGYRSGLRAHLRRVSEVAPNTAVVDREVGETSPLAGVALRDAALPAGTIVMTLQRGTEMVACRGDTVLRSGDRLGILSNVADADRVSCLVSGSAAEPAAPSRPDGSRS
jgi:H+/Cl- antiporter ClcA/predicted transcriptional regulator